MLMEILGFFSFLSNKQKKKKISQGKFNHFALILEKIRVLKNSRQGRGMAFVLI